MKRLVLFPAILLAVIGSAVAEENYFAKAAEAQEDGRICVRLYAKEFHKYASIQELQEGALYTCGSYIESYGMGLELSMSSDKKRSYTQEQKDQVVNKWKSVMEKELRLIVADTTIRLKAPQKANGPAAKP